jgi:hypothetical protein
VNRVFGGKTTSLGGEGGLPHATRFYQETPPLPGRRGLPLYRHPEWARGLAAEGRAFALEHGHARNMARR